MRTSSYRLATGLSLGLVLGAFTSGIGAQELNASAAEGLAKKSGCMTCHSVAQKKDAPSYKSIAEKYKDKGKADAEAVLVKHLTTNPKVKVDGKDEVHDSLKTKNEAEVKNVAKWILSR